MGDKGRLTEEQLKKLLLVAVRASLDYKRGYALGDECAANEERIWVVMK